MTDQFSMLPTNLNNQSAAEDQEIVFLMVSYADKDEARKLGARWNTTEKKWFVPEDCNPNNRKELIMRWGGDAEYIKVSYADKDDAKRYGASFDGKQKKWFIPSGLPEENKTELRARWGEGRTKDEFAADPNPSSKFVFEESSDY